MTLSYIKNRDSGVKVPSTSSLSVYTKVLAHNLNDIRNWASLIGLLLRICWCLLSVFLIYCSDEWKKLVNLIYCFQVLFRMNFKIMYFLMKILGNTPSADSAASRDSLSSQNATWGIVFFSSFYWWHIEYKGWMCERLLNLQEIYVSGQNICIEVYGNSVGTITPSVLCFAFFFVLCTVAFTTMLYTFWTLHTVFFFLINMTQKVKSAF